MARTGRPSGYNDKMPDKLIAAMMAGDSIVQFCSQERITRPTFYDWVQKHPDFSYAFDRGKIHCESFWEKWLKQNLNAEKVNSALVKLFFANRFDWHDKSESKSEIHHTHEVAEISELRNKYTKEI